MIDGREDQAAGLRRLFRNAPPGVVALYATGRYRTHNAVRAAHRIAGHAHRVLLLDEATGDEALTAALDLPAGPDLLQMLDGRLTLAGLLQPVPGLLGRVPAAAAALALPLLDDARRACLVEALRVLHRHAGFVLIHAGQSSASDPSPFVHAAPRRLLVAEASASGATEAYQVIKQLAAAGAGSLHVAVCRARNRADAERFFSSLQGLVRRHVGVPLAWLGEIERDDIAEGLSQPQSMSSPREPEAAFLRRLSVMARSRPDGQVRRE
ncbi:MAG: flagellar FleN [Azoarcus sp.]|uniref:Flagellar FleN n=1 Tax=Parazoarcus communis TaxID=41977 RepID=A0A2U8GKA9_9RHOO|nr:flagellar FleN [Parazoarcus communis]AWI73962.1 flagellar FleN [Parazoarcus communis]PLX67784.1 MAG: flagellar FleN [Azoarcus sp.]TVT60965.1 MAG: MinD/ParA family protein [Azoarcus sp. PHD]